MRRNIDADAAKMRDKAKAEYIREPSKGWKGRRMRWESRQREIEQTREALAHADAMDGHRHYRAHKSETDSAEREQQLMDHYMSDGEATVRKARDAQQIRSDQIAKAAREYENLKGEDIAPLELIKPSVKRATAEQLIAAGWGDFERHRIPEDWQTHPPTAKMPPASTVKLNGNGHKSPGAASDGRKLA